MKSLQQRMNEMSPYFRGIEVYNNALIVKVTFPSNWKYFQSSDERIKVTPGEDDENMVYYYADSSDTSFEDLFDIIEETIKVNLDTTLKLKLLKEKVEELREIFSNHTYDELQNLSIVFPSNRITTIVGNSGSGKSTLIKLILGFYKPQEGDVYVDRTSLKKMNIDSWRELCGVVLQDGKIFSGTIAENIAFGAKEIDITQVKNVAKIACIDDFILKQPGQYDMRIGPSGIDLSQGQKQRILIARALYKNPSLLIFDEATSSLDTVNERRIMENLEDFFKNRTVIVVAHRLSTVVNADNIIFLENGKIAEQGTHQQLVDRKGKYYELIKNQLELEC